MIFVVTALQSEARPLVEHFRLGGPDAAAPFRMYRSREMTLVVSGIGRVASAAATAYAFARGGEPRDRPWLNVGIAGHATAGVGSCWLATKILDSSNERSWYPSPVFETCMRSAAVVTVDRPESRFEHDALYDMEASAFFATASRLTPAELVHVVKVVSDNHEAPANRLKPADVTSLIEANLEGIAALIEQTGALADDLAGRPLPDPRPWIGERQFSAGQKRRLSRLLLRLAVVEGQEATVLPEEEAATSARELLAVLDERLRRQRLGF